MSNMSDISSALRRSTTSENSANTRLGLDSLIRESQDRQAEVEDINGALLTDLYTVWGNSNPKVLVDK